MENQELKFDTVSLRTLRAFNEKFSSLPDEQELSFEVVMLAFFPNAYRRMQKYASDCYTQGYIAGRAEGEKNEG